MNISTREEVISTVFAITKDYIASDINNKSLNFAIDYLEFFVNTIYNLDLDEE